MKREIAEALKRIGLPEMMAGAGGDRARGSRSVFAPSRSARRCARSPSNRSALASPDLFAIRVEDRSRRLEMRLCALKVVAAEREIAERQQRVGLASFVVTLDGGRTGFLQMLHRSVEVVASH